MKIITTIFLLLICGLGFSQSNTFTISGKIKGLDSKKMRLLFQDPSSQSGYRLDSIMVHNESFSYTGRIDKLTYLSIYTGVARTMKIVGNGFIPASSSSLLFFASPGAHIKVSGEITDFVNAYPSGDAANDDLAKLDKVICPMINESANLQVKLSNKNATDTSKFEEMRKLKDDLDKKVIEIQTKFVEDNPSSEAAIWMLSDMMVRTELSDEKAISLFRKMNKEKLVNIQYYTDVAKRVDGLIATRVGNEAPEIVSAHTYNGKKFNLKSLRGKYVVLDFWGTWCMPCVSGMPRMKEYLDKYRGKLEIVGIAQESDNGQEWKKFLDKNPGYQWYQILNRDGNNDLVLKYSVAGFPTKIIIDPKGKIVERFVGEDDGIYNKLDELIK